ncbi:hypothetical protein HXA34_13135 [Salipaludibacillus agaradhaerens]|uniref:hypothetical protein n=1 Tax=Salipaludibacillus agaradhaerens TaxID=76935 RepID=UPI002150C7F5|nr:hypothetical protein [Salipaludibacillus agaradhaerens]MCR6107243.1 hypothetical protein [Salipaludibacillus agaradhaerens]MCR6119272.1 hypothetical protein [Salipaludibacillus agaradhaerens]
MGKVKHRNRVFYIIFSLTLFIILVVTYFIFSSNVNSSSTLLSAVEGQDSHLKLMSEGLGKHLEEIEGEQGSFDETGPYEGGTFYRYPDVTYFTAYAKGPVIAVAARAENLTKKDVDAIAKLRHTSAILIYNNEAENTRVEIYEDSHFEVVIEYSDVQDSIELVWLTEHHLFSR